MQNMLLNKSLILEAFSDYSEEVKKRAKMGIAPMTAEERNDAVLRATNHHIGDKAETSASASKRKSINSDTHSNNGGMIDASTAANMKQRLKAAGY